MVFLLLVSPRYFFVSFVVKKTHFRPATSGQALGHIGSDLQTTAIDNNSSLDSDDQNGRLASFGGSGNIHKSAFQSQESCFRTPLADVAPYNNSVACAFEPV